MTPRAIDRIDNRGMIRGHLTVDDQKTLCGIEIGYRQAASNNGMCRRCTRIAEARTDFDPTAVRSQLVPASKRTP